MKNKAIKSADFFKVIEEKKPEFCMRTIQGFSEKERFALQNFVKEYAWRQTSIDVFQVIGTQHPDYVGMSWAEFLKKGKRMSLNLALFDANPGYYLQKAPKQPFMHYMQIDNSKYYVGDDGNHRTCIAKFFFFLKGETHLHGVNLHSYKIDQRAQEIHSALINLGFYVQPNATKISREDGPGWMVETYEINFKTPDGKTLTVDEAEKTYERIRGRKGIFAKIWHFVRKKRPSLSVSKKA